MANDRIPYRIEIDGGPVVRCWDPRDAPLLKDAVDSSLEHLRAWMPWAYYEPQELDAKAALLRQFRGKFDLDQDYIYGIFSADETRVLGGTGLHTRAGDGAFEIGYWVRADAVRQGIATRVAAVLTRVGIELAGVDRIEILVDVDNEVSSRVPRRLGYREEAILHRRLPTHDGSPQRDAVVFSMFAEDLAGSPAADVSYAAFDSRGLLLV